MSNNKYPYLVALALIERGGKRALPLGGKSLSIEINPGEDPGLIGESLAKDLLLRIFQQSEDLPLKRAAGDLSLLLVQVQMDQMQNKIPLIKAEWIKSGNKDYFLSELRDTCNGIWSLTFNKYEGSKFLSFSRS